MAIELALRKAFLPDLRRASRSGIAAPADEGQE